MRFTLITTVLGAITVVVGLPIRPVEREPQDSVAPSAPAGGVKVDVTGPPGYHYWKR